MATTAYDDLLVARSRGVLATLQHDGRPQLSTIDYAYDAVATLSSIASNPLDPTVEELVGVYRAIQGEHPDWDEYRAAMVADHRLVIALKVQRTYGWTPPAPR